MLRLYDVVKGQKHAVESVGQEVLDELHIAATRPMTVLTSFSTVIGTELLAQPYL
jgi:hypothetical protein